VTHALAEVLSEEPTGTWATWQEIAPGRYAEGGDAPAFQPAATHPPLVELLAFEGRPPELVERMLETVAEVLVRELELEPGNVFVRYVEATSGRLYTGGSVV
jgi:phenylpyruvate tautomerase PptA (4-oxalocrotonate tautomerase family)